MRLATEEKNLKTREGMAEEITKILITNVRDYFNDFESLPRIY